LINTAIKNFFWTPLVERTGRSVPEIMRFLISFIIYLLTFFGIIGFVFELPVTSLLATSGTVAGILGFAMQTSLANILSGIALNIDRSFRVGDWVKIGDFEEGKVVDMTWRVTQVQTRSQYLLNIPNNMVSHSYVHNFSYPSNQYWLKCIVHLDPKHDPRKVEEVLRRAMQAAETKIVENVEPMIWFKGIDVKDVSEGVASYVVFFKTEDYQYKFRVLKNVWRHIWVHLNQAGMITEAENVAVEETKLTEVLTKSNLQNMITGSSPS
jgi:branched-chain amino acid transport system substrate-binding protein